MRHDNVLLDCLILSDQNINLKPMYEEAYKELIQICRKYDAILDLSEDSVYVLNTTRSCRKAIRRLYGQAIQEERINKTMKLRGM